MSSMIVYNGQREKCDRKYSSNTIVSVLAMLLSLVEDMGIAQNREKWKSYCREKKKRKREKSRDRIGEAEKLEEACWSRKGRESERGPLFVLSTYLVSSWLRAMPMSDVAKKNKQRKEK